MTLKTTHDSLDEIPEQFRELYTEKAGKFELTGITGVQTPENIRRLETALAKERDEHKATKTKFQPWAELDHSEIMSKLDRIPELEAAAAGNLDEAAIEELVNKRVSGTINSKTAPLERQAKQLQTQLEEIQAERDALAAEKKQRIIHDQVRSALVKSKVLPEAQDDALMLAERVFEIREDDGAVITRDNVGVTPGLAAEAWLQEISEKRPHWWPSSTGGGAGGGSGGGGDRNPFSAEHWNMTEQGRIFREKGADTAERLAKAAGTTVGGPKPAAKK